MSYARKGWFVAHSRLASSYVWIRRTFSGLELLSSALNVHTSATSIASSTVGKPSSDVRRGWKRASAFWIITFRFLESDGATRAMSVRSARSSANESTTNAPSPFRPPSAFSTTLAYWRISDLRRTFAPSGPVGRTPDGHCACRIASTSWGILASKVRSTSPAAERARPTSWAVSSA
eukprot:scaffold1487_cov116-Isochrysis_galbana.AAC.10